MKRDVPCHHCFLSFNDTALSLFLDGPLPRCSSLPVPPNRMSNWVIAGHQHLLCVCVSVHARWCCFTPSTPKNTTESLFLCASIHRPQKGLCAMSTCCARFAFPSSFIPYRSLSLFPSSYPQSSLFPGRCFAAVVSWIHVCFLHHSSPLSFAFFSVSLSLILSLNLRGL